jgi:hypothetical protein
MPRLNSIAAILLSLVIAVAVVSTGVWAAVFFYGRDPVVPMRPDVSARRALWQGWRGASTYLEIEEKDLAEIEAAGGPPATVGRLRSRVESARSAVARFRADSIHRYGVPPEKLAE